MSKVDFHWKNNVNTLLIWIISLSLQHQTESSLRLCRIKKGKETRSFLSRSPYQIIYSAFISNQSITFTPITFMRRFAIFVQPRTSVSTVQRRTRYYTTYRPRPSRRFLSVSWWSLPRVVMPRFWEEHLWVRARKGQRCLSQQTTRARWALIYVW